MSRHHAARSKETGLPITVESLTTSDQATEIERIPERIHQGDTTA
jgi:hypothetical protein